MTSDQRRQAIKAAQGAGYRAFEGANGWYAAIERDGSHHQPSAGASYCSAGDALAEAGARFCEVDDDE